MRVDRPRRTFRLRWGRGASRPQEGGFREFPMLPGTPSTPVQIEKVSKPRGTFWHESVSLGTSFIVIFVAGFT